MCGFFVCLMILGRAGRRHWFAWDREAIHQRWHSPQTPLQQQFSLDGKRVGTYNVLDLSTDIWLEIAKRVLTQGCPRLVEVPHSRPPVLNLQLIPGSDAGNLRVVCKLWRNTFDGAFRLAGKGRFSNGILFAPGVHLVHVTVLSNSWYKESYGCAGRLHVPGRDRVSVAYENMQALTSLATFKEAFTFERQVHLACRPLNLQALGCISNLHLDSPDGPHVHVPDGIRRLTINLLRAERTVSN